MTCMFISHKLFCLMYLTTLKIYRLDHAHFLSAPGLAWQAALKKNQSKIRPFN